MLIDRKSTVLSVEIFSMHSLKNRMMKHSLIVSLSNHEIKRDMMSNINHALDDMISTSLHFISFNFIQVRCHHHVQLNVQVYEVSFQIC